MYCRNCGKIITDGKAFCRYCGARTQAPFALGEKSKRGAFSEDTLPVNGAVSAAEQQQTPQYYVPPYQMPSQAFGAQPPPGASAQKNNTPVIIAVSAVAAVALIALIVVLVMGNKTSGGAPQAALTTPAPAIEALLETPETQVENAAVPPSAAAPTEAPAEAPTPVVTAAPTVQPGTYAPDGHYVPYDAERFMDAIPTDPIEDLILQGYYRDILESELYVLTKDEVALIRNGMYALSGEVFAKQKNIDYFFSKSWYEVYGEDVDYLFNEHQNHNVALCKSYERLMGW